MAELPNHVTGSCLCQAIEYTLAMPNLWCAHCHCHMCQRAHGAGYVTWVGFCDNDIEFTQGEDQLKWHDSSKGAQRGFCDECGSTLFFKSENWAGELHVTLANINEQEHFRPAAHAYYDSHAEWMAVDDRLRIV